MDRLTKRTSYGVEPTRGSAESQTGTIMLRLADYEDAAEARENAEYVVDVTGREAKHILDLLTAEAAGTLQNISCKGCRREDSLSYKEISSFCVKCRRSPAREDHFEPLSGPEAEA